MSRNFFFQSSPADINILLLGETGVGKSTFINGFVNYLHCNTLDDALRSEMKILIPSSFTLNNSETDEEINVMVGNSDRNENVNSEGASSTQACRSYLFQIGNRRLRLIDAPGVGDTRGRQVELQNFANILAYISQYKSLNGICILLKPAQTRISIYFRYCIKEILRHLHRSAAKNIMFVFTNTRSTFYKPGETTRILRTLLKELHGQTGVEVPFDQSNTFLFDNEGFRFLAAYKQGVRFIMDDKKSYDESWQKSVEQISRLITKILQCDPHAVQETKSLNEAQQLIHQLSRPVAETSRLILENIGTAEKYKKRLLEGQSADLANGLPQKVGHYVPLAKRLTVCISPGCTRLIEINGEMRVDYYKHCHDGCYLDNVVQESIGHPDLQGCAAMNRRGFCNNCGCPWQQHMHITYRYETEINYIPLGGNTARNSTPKAIMDLIDQRLKDLRREEKQIRDICVRLSAFLKANSITPFNDDLIEYLNHFLEEEKQKRSERNVDNGRLIHDLEQHIEAYRRELQIYTESIEDTKTSDIVDGNDLDQIFDSIQELYTLPISGKSIQDQISGIRRNQIKHIEQADQHVTLPANRHATKVLFDLTALINQR